MWDVYGPLFGITCLQSPPPPPQNALKNKVDIYLEERREYGNREEDCPTCSIPLLRNDATAFPTDPCFLTEVFFFGGGGSSPCGLIFVYRLIRSYLPNNVCVV